MISKRRTRFQGVKKLCFTAFPSKKNSLAQSQNPLAPGYGTRLPLYAGLTWGLTLAEDLSFEDHN